MWKVFRLFVYSTIEVLAVVVSALEHPHGDTNQAFRGESKGVSSYRLPNTTVPQMYLINLDLRDFDRDNLRFHGRTRIKINIVEDTNVIVLHSAVLIESTTLTKSDINGTPVTHTHDVDIEREFLSIRTTEEILSRGSIFWLSIDYIGFIHSSVQGLFYRQLSTTSTNGTERYEL